jgi:hypothetical protein
MRLIHAIKSVMALEIIHSVFGAHDTKTMPLIDGAIDGSKSGKFCIESDRSKL